MMGPRERHWLKGARDRVLDDGESMNHSLMCTECDLRREALTVLTVVDWTERDFVTAYCHRLLEACGDE